MTKSINDYGPSGDSISLGKIDGKAFTPILIEKSDYTDNSGTTPGIKITTEESFLIDGESHSKFHTTRTAIVQKLLTEQLLEDISNGLKLKLKCVSKKSANGRNYFDLEDA